MIKKYKRTRFIAIDAGNSFLKLAAFEGLKMMSKQTLNYSNFDFSSIKDFGANKAIVASVVPSKNLLIRRELEKAGISSVSFLSHNTKLGIKVEYNPPETIGADRLALLCGAYYFYSSINNKPSLVISCGSAITINLIDEKGIFKGGAIFPGYSLMVSSLATLELIPEFEDYSFEVEFKHSTRASICSGITAAIVGAIEKFVEKAPYANVILSGSYAQNIAGFISTPFILDPELPLKGLAIVHIINEED